MRGVFDAKPEAIRFEIPGVLWRFDPPGTELPLVFDSPHSGSVYPDDFHYCCPLPVLRRAEDAYVDELYAAAPNFGATLIAAAFPRSYVDANRSPDDIDPALVTGELPPHLTPRPASRVGLLRKHAQPGIPIYARPLEAEEVVARIERYYAPYHRELAGACDRLHARFGAVWHVDCHSMPSNGSRHGKGERGDFVLGDRDGTTCGAEFTTFIAGILRGLGYEVRINDGYKGVEIVRRHGRPEAGRHSLQIEIDRSLYMNQKTLEKTAGFERLRTDLAQLLGAIAGFVRERLPCLGER